MRFSKGLAFPLILVLGSIISSAVLTVIILIHLIHANHSPTIKNAERLVKQGHYVEALSSVSQIDSGCNRLSILKAKIFIFIALQNQNQNRWKNYGTDETDWFKSEEIDSAMRLLKNVIGSGDLEFYSDAHFYLGMIYNEKGWFYQAEDEFLKVLKKKPFHIDARLTLSSVYVKEKRYVDAEKELRLGYKSDPDNPDIAKNMAFLYRYYIDMPESAIVWFNRYLNCAHPRDININDARIQIEDLLQRYPEYSPSESQAWRGKGRKIKFSKE